MTDWDVVIIGRSYAALSAALVLGRARKSVLVLGDGPARNDDADHVHGLLSRDHTPASTLIRSAEDDLDRYETVRLEREHVDGLELGEKGVVVRFGDRSTTASVVVLATGVNDDLPAVPGLAGLWGRGVYNCPFCDGYEHADRPWALFGDEIHPHQVHLFRNWASSVTVFHPDPTGEIATSLDKLPVSDVAVEKRPVRRVKAKENSEGLIIELSDGESVDVEVAFVSPSVKPNSRLARSVGCRLDEKGFIQVDRTGATSVRNVYAIGDVTRSGPHQVALAVADGVFAAAAITGQLLRE